MVPKREAAVVTRPATSEAVQQFVRPPAAANTPAPPVSGSRGSKRGLVTRRQKGELDRVTAYLPLELGRRLRAHCAQHRVELSATVAQAMEAWLRGSGELVSPEDMAPLADVAKAIGKPPRELLHGAILRWAEQARAKRGG